MFARSGGGDCELCVEGVGRRDVDRVDIGLSEELCVARKGSRRSVFRSEGSGVFERTTGYSDEFAVARRSESRREAACDSPRG